MAVQIEVDTKRKLVITRFTGDFQPADLLGIPGLIRSHQNFDPSFSEIVDFSEVAAGDISSSALQEHLKRESVFSPTSMHVVIAPRPYVFGLARMGQVYAEKTRPNFAVVKSMKEAHEVLGQAGTM